MSKEKVEAVKYPYSRLQGMKDFMAFVQEPEWKPPQIDVNLLKKLHMAKGKEHEAIKALRFLGVLDNAGIPTNEFDALKQDYQGTMKRLVRKSYAEIFSLIPQRQADQARLVSCFDKNVETGEYQAKLFVWLCDQAGLELPKVEKHFHRARHDKKPKSVSGEE